ncbi:uncharacterized protein LOC135680982 [Rhopilema esculentum]|uniref:uncharacterized protein LOC135680982 n=1 Tax=Rhopilema esculentum TaxID=499914 RepID=UPI0031CEAE23|eukprot:gene12939-3698_t
MASETVLRSIASRVLASKAGPLQRLIGSLDIKGQGTEHSLADVDPVMLCDIGVLNGKGLPPFGMHPHYGLIAVTTVVEGCFTDADNLNGVSDQLIEAFGIYAASSGRGVCHEETTAKEGRHVAVQAVFKIPADKLDFPPEVIRVGKDDIPVMDLEGGKLRVNVGKLGNVESPVKLKAFPRAVMVRAFVDQGKTMEVPLDGDLEQGFVIVIEGKSKIGAEKEQLEKDGGCLVFGKGGSLLIDNSEGEHVCDALIVAGKPLNEPWVKLLGRNGFIIAKDEEEANKVMDVIQKEENDFSFKKMS